MYFVRRLFILAVIVVLCVAVIGLPFLHADKPPEQSKKTYGLIGKITAVAGKRDELIATLLRGTKEMPGCLSYVVAKDPADANTIWVTEVWEDEASHKASLSLPAVREALTKGRPLIAKLDRIATTEPAGGHGLVPAKGR